MSLVKNKKHYILFLLIVFFCCSKISFASLEITEIMYAPENGSSYEWVEIFNNSENHIDLNKYRFFRGDNSGPITLRIGSDTILKANNYAIIAKSMADYSWLDFSGMIFSASTLSLPDSGSNTYIAISDPVKNIISEIVYDPSLGGSKSTKSSLSKIDGIWTSGIPTPGKENIALDLSDIEDEEELGTSSSNQTADEKKEEIEAIKFTTKINAPKVIVAGTPFELSSLTTNNKKQTMAVGRFVWNFGDGSSKELKNSEPFEYVYEYPGEYNLTLSYYDSSFSKTPESKDKIVARVITAGLHISSLGDEKDPYIELGNNSSYEFDISNWVVLSNYREFIIPGGTVLLPGKKIKLSSKITNFTKTDFDSLIVMSPNRNLIVKYEDKNSIIKSNFVSSSNVKSVSSVRPNQVLNVVEYEDVLNLDQTKEDNVINLSDLGASSASAKFNLSKQFYYYIGLILIIVIAMVSFIISKRDKKIEEDYLTDEIEAKDIKIIE